MVRFWNIANEIALGVIDEPAILQGFNEYALGLTDITFQYCDFRREWQPTNIWDSNQKNLNLMVTQWYNIYIYKYNIHMCMGLS